MAERLLEHAADVPLDPHHPARRLLIRHQGRGRPPRRPQTFWVSTPSSAVRAASAAVGVALPVLLRLARRDLRLASGPIALAAADLATLLRYFNLGRWLLG